MVRECSFRHYGNSPAEGLGFKACGGTNFFHLCVFLDVQLLQKLFTGSKNPVNVKKVCVAINELNI